MGRNWGRYATDSQRFACRKFIAMNRRKRNAGAQPGQGARHGRADGAHGAAGAIGAEETRDATRRE